MLNLTSENLKQSTLCAPVDFISKAKDDQVETLATVNTGLGSNYAKHMIVCSDAKGSNCLLF